jgi:hypothetical protein
MAIVFHEASDSDRGIKQQALQADKNQAQGELKRAQ